MAKPQNVLIGKTSGSVGDATFTSWLGINVLKSKAVNNYTNPTAEQLQNNSKFGVMQAFAKMIATFIVSGFKAMKIGRTEYNAFQKANPYSVVIGGSAPNFFVDPSEIKISQGPELPAGLAAAEKEADGANDIVIQWIASVGAPQDSQVYAAAFSSTTGDLLASSLGTVVYGDESLTLTATGLGTNIATTVVHVFYVNPSNGKACDSIIVPTA
jgi:hypothetical protein